MSEHDGDLAVFLGPDRCGTLTATEHLAYTFAYSHEWVAAERPGLSLSLPADGTPIDPTRARAWFGGLLPEGRARRQIAEQRGVDPLDDMALLRVLGRECAGAVSIVLAQPPAAAVTPGSRAIRWLSESELAELVSSLRVAGEADPLLQYSVSLAGAQLKRGVLVDLDTGAVGLPEGDEVSSHILKLEPAGYPGMTQVEHCMQGLAAAVGLRAAPTSVRNVGEELVLLVERYDRTPTTAGHPGRLHQEDFCQALGRIPEHKYERPGEPDVEHGPTAVEIVELLRRCAQPSVQQVSDFLQLFWFNVIIGNVDAHSKNYSLLYARNLRSFAVAPLYDAICVASFHADTPHCKRQADEPLVMSVGGQHRFWQLSPDDIAQFASDLSIAPGFLRRQVRRLIAATAAAVGPHIAANQAGTLTGHPILDTVRQEIERRCEFLATVLE